MEPGIMQPRGSVTSEDFGGELSPEMRRVARQQLREDEAARQQALQQLRDWLRKNQDVHNCRLDANFLLRFLRVKKFSVPMAQQTLLKYLSLRRSLPHLVAGLDLHHLAVYELISNGYIFPLPKRDKEGRRVVFTLASKFDPYKYNKSDMAKAHVLTYEALLEEEETQICGFCHVSDVAQVSPAHVTLWPPREFSSTIKWGEQSMPMRHRAMHFLNLPSAVRVVFDLCRTLFTDKMRERIQVHSSLEDLHEQVDPQILPKEYGGQIPMREMIDSWLQELESKRERLLQLDRMSLSSSFQPHRNRGKNGNGERLKNSLNSLPGSFRRLEVD